MLTSKATPRQVVIPHEAGAWMQFRRLPWPLLLAAEQAHSKESIRNVAEMGAEVRELMKSSETATAVRQTKAERDLADVYDRAVVLRSGIVAWSYEDEVTPEAIEDLDEQTADWAFREILKPSVRSDEERLDRLFQPASVS